MGILAHISRPRTKVPLWIILKMLINMHDSASIKTRKQRAFHLPTTPFHPVCVSLGCRPTYLPVFPLLTPKPPKSPTHTFHFTQNLQATEKTTFCWCDYSFILPSSSRSHHTHTHKHAHTHTAVFGAECEPWALFQTLHPSGLQHAPGGPPPREQKSTRQTSF